MCRTLHCIRCNVLVILVFGGFNLLLPCAEGLVLEGGFVPSYPYAYKYSSKVLSNGNVSKSIKVQSVPSGSEVTNETNFKQFDVKKSHTLNIPKFDESFLNHVKPYLIFRSKTNKTNLKSPVHSNRIEINTIYENLKNFTSSNNQVLTENLLKLNFSEEINSNKTSLKASWPVKVMRCLILRRDIVRCMKIFFLQRAKFALEKSKRENSNITLKWFEDLFSKDIETSDLKDNFPESDLDEEIIGTVLQIFDRSDLNFYFLPGVSLRLTSDGQKNHTVNVAVRMENTEAADGRKIKIKMSDLYPILLTPPLIMAGILPLLLPGIKMAVMTVTMLNQMVFMSALFSLIRGYIFDPRPTDRVVYVNYGYKNDPMHDMYSQYNENFNFESQPSY